MSTNLKKYNLIFYKPDRVKGFNVNMYDKNINTIYKKMDIITECLGYNRYYYEGFFDIIS